MNTELSDDVALFLGDKTHDLLLFSFRYVENVPFLLRN